jgi:hypothetical protein
MSVRSILFFAMTALLSLPAARADAGDITDYEARHYPYYRVADATGLHCRRGPGTSFGVAHTFATGEVIFAGETLENQGEGPWLFVPRDASGCFVRAHTRHVEPQRRFEEFRETFWEGGAPAFWVVVDEQGPLNCRQDLGAGFDRVVARLAQGTLIQDSQTFGTDGTADTVFGVDYRPGTGEPWLLLRVGGNRCFVRASSAYIRPSGALP